MAICGTCQTRPHSPKAVFDKNVTRLDTFARVIRHFCKFGPSGHCLIYFQVGNIVFSFNLQIYYLLHQNSCQIFRSVCSLQRWDVIWRNYGSRNYLFIITWIWLLPTYQKLILYYENTTSFQLTNGRHNLLPRRWRNPLSRGRWSCGRLAWRKEPSAGRPEIENVCLIWSKLINFKRKF